MKKLSVDLREQLAEAAQTANQDNIEEVLNSIESIDAALAGKLHKMVDNYNFDDIVKLVEM